MLFWLPAARREAALRARLAGPPPHGTPGAASAAAIPGVPVATAAPGTAPGGPGPAEAAWLPAASPGPRLRLAQLAPAVLPGPAEDPQTAGPPGGLAWFPTGPVPPAWHALPGTAGIPEASDD